MSKRCAMTVKDHREVAAALGTARGELQTLFVEVVQFSQTKKQQRPWLRMQDAIDHVRHLMDEQLFQEHPAKYQGRVYYPGEAVQP